MGAREQRGLVIAATQKVETNGCMWFVPSQSGKGRYGVVLGDKPTCSCPDNQDAGFKCKHIFAAEFVLKRTTQKENPDGSTTVTTETHGTDRCVAVRAARIKSSLALTMRQAVLRYRS